MPKLFQAAVRQAAELLRAGEVVALPTETVYGLAANALDATAVAKIYAAKGRPSHNPIIVHVADLEMARRCVETWPESADELARAFWPGPLTLVMPKSPIIPDIVTAGGKTVAVRWPSHPFIQAVIRECGFPLAAPSANRSNLLSPTTAEHVRRSLGGRIRLIVDGGPSQVGIESTVLDLTQSPPKVLRAGMIHEETLLAVWMHGGEERPQARGGKAKGKGLTPEFLAQWLQDGERLLNLVERLQAITGRCLEGRSGTLKGGKPRLKSRSKGLDDSFPKLIDRYKHLQFISGRMKIISTHLQFISERMKFISEHMKIISTHLVCRSKHRKFISPKLSERFVKLPSKGAKLTFSLAKPRGINPQAASDQAQHRKGGALPELSQSRAQNESLEHDSNLPGQGAKTRTAPLRSPGMLTKHYAPKAKLLILSWKDEADLRGQIAQRRCSLADCHVIAHTRVAVGGGFEGVSVMPREAGAFARAIYAELHQCDEAGARCIVVEAPPDAPEWRGIADRLQRASA